MTLCGRCALAVPTPCTPASPVSLGPARQGELGLDVPDGSGPCAALPGHGPGSAPQDTRGPGGHSGPPAAAAEGGPPGRRVGLSV